MDWHRYFRAQRENEPFANPYIRARLTRLTARQLRTAEEVRALPYVTVEAMPNDTSITVDGITYALRSTATRGDHTFDSVGHAIGHIAADIAKRGATVTDRTSPL